MPRTEAGEKNTPANAVAILSKGLQQHPDSLTMLELSGNIKYDVLRDFASAERDFSRAADVEARTPREHLLKGSCILFSGLLAAHRKDRAVVNNSVRAALACEKVAWLGGPVGQKHVISFLCACAYGRLAKELGDDESGAEVEQEALHYLTLAADIAGRTGQGASLEKNVIGEIDDDDPAKSFSTNLANSTAFQKIVESL